MSFDVALTLRRATGRAKSDVANKLVSMFLHEVSRSACAAGGMSVSDGRYAESVKKAFGEACIYCGRELESDRVAVEHLNGMNRISVGLHVPGNVAISCKRCNNEKRRDDQTLSLADSGWRSFLSHDGVHCELGCNACAYWRSIWPDDSSRSASLAEARERILRFQEPYAWFIDYSRSARKGLRQKIEILYRDCQRFATEEIAKLTADLDLEMGDVAKLDL